MPVISGFYGILIEIRYDDHNPPHFHAVYGEYKSAFDFDGNIIKGELPPKKAKMVSVWAEIHKEELITNWEMAKNGKEPYDIQPLR